MVSAIVYICFLITENVLVGTVALMQHMQSEPNYYSMKCFLQDSKCMKSKQQKTKSYFVNIQ